MEPEEEQGDLFESDMKLSLAQLEMVNDAKIAGNDTEGQKAVGSASQLWDNATVPYILDRTLSKYTRTVQTAQ